MSNIRSEIEAAALTFADSLFQILCKYSIDDLASEVRAPGKAPRSAAARRPRRQPASEPVSSPRAKRAGGRRAEQADDVATLAQRVVDFVARQGESGRKAILEGTGAEADALHKALAHARGHGALALRGEKRNARYVATGKPLG